MIGQWPTPAPIDGVAGSLFPCQIFIHPAHERPRKLEAAPGRTAEAPTGRGNEQGDGIRCSLHGTGIAYCTHWSRCSSVALHSADRCPTEEGVEPWPQNMHADIRTVPEVASRG
jgi:hypothetical protein